MNNWMKELITVGLCKYGDENRRIYSELSQRGGSFAEVLLPEASAEAM